MLLNTKAVGPVLLSLLLLGCAQDGFTTTAAFTASGTESAGDDDDSDDDSPSDEDDSSPMDEDDSDTNDSADTEPDEDTTDSDGSTGEPPETGIPILGDGTHDITTLDVSVVATSADSLNRPSDCEFHNQIAGELWVTNMADDSIVIVEQAGQAGQASSRRFDAGSGPHFLARPSGLAFGTPGVMATAQNTNLITQQSTPWDFMGPTLWGADKSHFGGGHNSHLDMLHNSPNSSGIAWESANIYWIFDGEHGSLTRYDFHSDHGLGGTDHTDGEVYRFAQGELGYAGDIASHVAFDPTSGAVYAADTANNRVFVLDSNTGDIAGDLIPNYDGGVQRGVTGAVYSSMIQGADMPAPMLAPSGIELHDGYLFVTDNMSSVIFGFTPEGELVDWLDTQFPAGTLMGFAFDQDGSLFAVDAAGNQIYRIAVRGA